MMQLFSDFEKVWLIFKRLNSIYASAISFPGIYLTEIKRCIHIKKYLYTNIHNSIIYNSKKVEENQKHINC